MVVRKAFLRSFWAGFYKLPAAERDFLSLEIPYYQKLAPKEKRIFEFRVIRFLKSHEIIGRGIAITREMELRIACSAIQVTFGLQNYLFSAFHTVLIYPTSYTSSITNLEHKGEANPTLQMLVFSWEDFLAGNSISDDNLNLGFHEFTHALHISFLRKRSLEANAFLNAYNNLLKVELPKIGSSIRSDGYFRVYGFENHFELLSVMVECFFETPEVLYQKYPTVYNSLKKMLNQDLLA